MAKIEENRITIAIIPHTYQVTNLNSLVAGDLLNIEVDVLARYAEKQRSRAWTVEELLSRGF